MFAAGMMIAASLAPMQEGSAARTVDAVIQCREITDEKARLACFDRAVATLAAAKDEVVVVDKEEVRKVRRSLFGFATPRSKLLGNDDARADREEVKEVESTISRVSRDGSGYVTVTLADDSVWAFTMTLPVEPKVGDPIRIKSAAFDSYMGSVKGRIGKRIRRVR